MPPTPLLASRARLRRRGAAAGRDHRRLGRADAPVSRADVAAALAGVTLVEAANERDEAVAIAIALRQRRRASPAARPRWSPATATWRAASRPNCCASASAPTIPAARRSPTRRRPTLLTLHARGRFRPGDPVAVLSLLKHPLLASAWTRRRAPRRRDDRTGGAARRHRPARHRRRWPTCSRRGLPTLAGDGRAPFWLARTDGARHRPRRAACWRALRAALSPLAGLRAADERADLPLIARATVAALEALGARRRRRSRRALCRRCRREAGRVPARRWSRPTPASRFAAANGPTSWRR